MPTTGPEPGPARLLLVAACALVDADGRVLVAQRPAGQADGGLVGVSRRQARAPARRPRPALIRELREELGIDTEAELPRTR